MLNVKTILFGLFFAYGIFSSPAESALKFNGTNAYVDFGAATHTLGVTNFTIECWFKVTGVGSTASSGDAGIRGVPLVAKGKGESESQGTNCNYFLAITSANQLIADFEETNGPNHPLLGTHTFSGNVWHHAALTYDGTNLTLYLDGVLDNSVAAGGTPDYTSVQHAGVASSMNSAGVPGGYFDGFIDEVRIWNYARTPRQIKSAMNSEITSDIGLLGRWGFNEGKGSIATNSVPGSPNGILYYNPVWTNDIPFTAARSVSLSNH